VHKNLAKVAASAQGGVPGMAEKSSSSMPLQPSSISNLNREASADAPKDLMNKLHSIRNTLMSSAPADTAPPQPTASAEEPTSSTTALSSSTSGLAEAEGADTSSVRASQSVLSLQERLARLRA